MDWLNILYLKFVEFFNLRKPKVEENPKSDFGNIFVIGSYSERLKEMKIDQSLRENIINDRKKENPRMFDKLYNNYPSPTDEVYDGYVSHLFNRMAQPDNDYTANMLDDSSSGFDGGFGGGGFSGGSSEGDWGNSFNDDSSNSYSGSDY